MERARAELRRVLHRQLPVLRPARHPRGVHHRRPAGPVATADDVYRRTYATVAGQNAAHYQRYPGDMAQAALVAQHLAGHDVRLPDGAPLPVQAFQSLGIMLGRAPAATSCTTCWRTRSPARICRDVFRYAVEAKLSFAAGPLYALLHEPCYAQGCATRWAAQRIRASSPGSIRRWRRGPGTAPLLFTGEMIYPWMIDADPVLRPLREAADLLAERDDWPPLYDPSRLAPTRHRRPPPFTTTTCTWTASSRWDGQRDPRAAHVGDERIRA